MIELDGTKEEGGGQILRTALGLSVFTKKPFRITKIRQSRKIPGLKNQHLEAIQALKKLCNAEVTGDFLGSSEITFDPGNYKPQKLELDICSAGSITLLLQSLIVPMIMAKKKTTLTIKGGTDVNKSMLFDYFKFVFLPQLKKYADISCTVKKRGYYPKGQGIVEISVNPKESRKEVLLEKQEKLLSIRGIVNSSLGLQKKLVAERISQAAAIELKKMNVSINIEINYSDSFSDGCGISLWSIHSDKDELDPFSPIILGADEIGEIHITSEEIGKKCAKKLVDEIRSGAAADKHCADNLIPFLGIFGGKIKTSEITSHILANIYVTESFLDVKFEIKDKEISVLKPYLAQYPS